MNRADTEKAIAGLLPRRARQHLPMLMAVVDMHAAAEREGLARVLAQATGQLEQAKAEAAELAKQVTVLREERGELNRALAAVQVQRDRLHEQLAAASKEAAPS